MLKRARKAISLILIILKTGFLRRAPFLYKLLEINPTSSTLMLTDRCNMRCIMCRQWRKPLRKELSLNDWKSVTDDLKKNGIKNLHLSGGEPLLRNDIEEIISHAKRKGFVVGLTTNAVLLDKTKLEKLIRSGIRSIAVSMDATGDRYDQIRGVKGSFLKVKEALEMLSREKRTSDLDVYINFTLMKNNINELEKVLEFAESIKVPVALCLLDKASEIFDLDENKTEFWIGPEKDSEGINHAISFLREKKIKNPKALIINFPAINFIKDYFRDPRQKNTPCVSSQDRVIIDPYGELFGGCMAMGKFGNIKENNFTELKKSKKYKSAKKNMFYKNCRGCSCGYLFNIKCTPRFIMEDLYKRARNRTRLKIRLNND